MDRPEANGTANKQPDGVTGQTPQAFFPDFATVRVALEAGQIGIWSWDIASNKASWSSNIESIAGLAPGTFDGTYACFENNIHQEDRPKVFEAINSAMQTGSRYEVRFRVASRKERPEIWIEATGAVAMKDGAPARMTGLCHDVTEQLKLQKELRSRAKQQEALAQLGERALLETDIERPRNDVVSTIALTLPVDFVKVLELLPGGKDLLLRAGFGWNPAASVRS